MHPKREIVFYHAQNKIFQSVNVIETIFNCTQNITAINFATEIINCNNYTILATPKIIAKALSCYKPFVFVFVKN